MDMDTVGVAVVEDEGNAPSECLFVLTEALTLQ